MKTNKKIRIKDTIRGVIIVGIIIALIFIISAELGETNVEFSIASAVHSCQYNEEGDISYWTWWETNPTPPPDGTLYRQEVGFPLSATPPIKVGCYYPGGWPSNGCCPDDIQCNPPAAEDHPDQCYGFAPEVCSDYNKYSDPQAYCEAFNINVAIRSVELFTDIVGICSGEYFIEVEVPYKTNCKRYTSNCRCYWDVDAGECKSTSTDTIFCDDGQYEGNCTQTTISKQDDCIEKGVITYIWNANWTINGTGLTPEQIQAARPAYCKDGTKTFSCNMIKLSVFTFMNVVLFILIIITLYYFIDKKEEKNKEEKIENINNL